MAKKKMENPLEKSKKMPTFEERYEESLIKQLFESEIKKAKEKLLDENDDEADYFEDQRIFQHQKRDGE
jgi:hypothetical protein